MNLFRRAFVGTLALVFSLGAAGAAQAATQSEAFSEARFRALQGEGQLILVDVAAGWCPTCAKQAKLVKQYREERPEVPLHVLRVDFDDQKRWVKHFKAPRQSTLILYRGSERVWFSVAETNRKAIFAALDEAASSL